VSPCRLLILFRLFVPKEYSEDIIFVWGLKSRVETRSIVVSGIRNPIKLLKPQECMIQVAGQDRKGLAGAFELASTEIPFFRFCHPTRSLIWCFPAFPLFCPIPGEDFNGWLISVALHETNVVCRHFCSASVRLRRLTSRERPVKGGSRERKPWAALINSTAWMKRDPGPQSPLPCRLRLLLSAAAFNRYIFFSSGQEEINKGPRTGLFCGQEFRAVSIRRRLCAAGTQRRLNQIQEAP
jgi:hypothetical protein